ncbi:MAG TPA: tetratricopeptide repeat protein, partial [Hyphomicrobiaceae bacterium]|nr:tetratricopeptide repeat protein [Hyphomicrobiaceae bacterium]
MHAAHGRANVPVALPIEKKAAPSQLNSLPAGFVAPPRTISDITAILDGEKPDADKIEKRKVAADAAAPTNIERADLAWFYYTRGNARAQLGRLNEAIDDANKALETGRGVVDANRMGRFQQFAGLQYSVAGNPKKALSIFAAQARDTNVQGAKGFRFNGHRNIAWLLIQMGDIPQADAYLRRSLTLMQEARTSGMPAWRESYALLGQSWEADLETHRAIIFEARGQFRDAEAAYTLAEQRIRASVKGVTSQKNAPPEAQILQAADNLVLNQARMKARQGRLAEAEADARRALLARLQDQGKYHPLTSRFVSGLAEILVEQGRYEEAERLVRAAFDISRTVGVAEDSQAVAQQLLALGSILTLQQKSAEAAVVYADLDKAIARWDPQRRQPIDLNTSRITSLYASGQIEAGLAAAQELLKRESTLLGEKHFSTAAARGTLAVGYMRAGRHADAVREFKAAIPILMAAARENADDDNTTAVVARSARLQSIVEAYVSLLTQRQAGGGDDVAAETFHLADAIRGQSVQQALTASSARMSAKDPALADLIRKEQDLTKQVNAQLGTLNNALALPASERDDSVIKALNASIETVRADRDKARTDIRRGFPAYADLIEPRSPGVDDVRASLRDDEALLSFYFGQQNSFVWVVPKSGPVAFETIAATLGDLESMVRRLREPLEAPGETISDILPFDLKLAHELYGMLLKPVEAGWKSAKSLIVVTNGALGLLPLSLLPTAPSEVTEAADLPFEGYRKVPWLMRSHAVTMVPSVAALRTLRRLPQASAKREPLIGFGDPYFSVEQAAEADKAGQPLQVAAASRGIPLRRRAVIKTRQVDSADLALLPRLPDTAEELTSMALSLQTDPSK